MFARGVVKLVCSVSLFLFVLALVGCSKGGGDGKNTVTGKVTQGGQPVAGTVTFIDSANKEFASPIGADGKYMVIGPATGQAKITVKGAGGGLIAPGGKDKDAAPGAGGVSGVAPNARYAKPDNGLTYEVKAGEQTHDIELKP